MTGACAVSAAFTGKSSRSTTIPNWTYKTVPTCSPTDNDQLLQQRRSRWPGSTANDPERAQRQHRLLRRHHPHDSPTRGVRFGRLRYHSEDVDFHRGYPLLPFRRIGARRRRWQLLLQEFCADHLLRPLHVGNQRQRKAGRVGPSNPGSAPYGTNLNATDLNNSTYSGFRSRANLSWHITEDMLLYYTWSQGFRPGGFNRGIKTVQPIGGSRSIRHSRPSTARHADQQ